MKRVKIAIIGAGAVGATTAYALLLQRINADLLLVDIDQTRCKGEIADLEDANTFCIGRDIMQGDASQAALADIIIIAAGIPQNPGQSRTELLQHNKEVVTSIFQELIPLQPDAIVIMVTNPVDCMTYYAQQLSGLPRSQVFGSGTFLDTQRLREAVSKEIKISEKSIHAYVLGEHGDSQFVAWFCARVAGIPLDTFVGMTPEHLQRLAKDSREKVYEIIACKGATYYGIATCLGALCRTILGNEQRATPISCYDPEFDVCLSQLAVLDRSGIQRILPLPLSKKEQELYKASARSLRALIESCP